MSARVNGDSDSRTPRVRVDVDPASARPQPRSTAEPRGALRWAADGVGPGPETNAHVIPPPSPVPVAESGASVSRLPLATHAGVVTRLLAAAVDAVVVVFLVALLDLAAAGARFLWSPVDFRWPRPTTFPAVVVLLLVAVAYLTVGWALAGRTYGDKLLGLRVLTSRHELLGWTRSAVRALTCAFWPVGLLWGGVSRTRRSVADVLLRSVVVYDTQPYARSPDVESAKAPRHTL